MKFNRGLFYGLLFTLLVVFSMLAQAHFELKLNVRIIHVQQIDKSLNIYVRTPMPYLVADLLGPMNDKGLPEPAPYTTNELEDNQLQHHANVSLIQQNQRVFSHFAASRLELRASGKRLPEQTVNCLLSNTDNAPDFATLEKARKRFERNDVNLASTYVGDILVDCQITYTVKKDTDVLSLAFNANPQLPGQSDTVNVLLEYTDADAPVLTQIRCIMTSPIALRGAPHQAVKSMIKAGAQHIISGHDHVLFVLTLILASTTLLSLTKTVTGFTLGHSMTLILGVLHITPEHLLFIRLVELSIALSIIYMAVRILRPPPTTNPSGVSWRITMLLGLLHGLGFSFMLRAIIAVDSPNLWQSLLSFNIGVELGQLAIVALLWPLLVWLNRRHPQTGKVVKQWLAIGALLTATIWAIQRGFLLIQTS